MNYVFIKGFIAGGSLIVAIGAQNAFVLSQGINKNYVLLIPFICFLCDAVFISLGVAGLGSILASVDWLKTLTGYCGAGFLFYYGSASLLSVFSNKKMGDSEGPPKSYYRTIFECFAVTLLNPHFYLDTVFLLGGISSQFKPESRFFFGFGAVSASLVWFFSLSLGASYLRPFFKKELSWKILDFIIFIIMFYIGFSLIRDFIYL